MAERPTHLDERNRARMVDVSDKPAAAREATAGGRVRMSSKAFEAARAGAGPKGDIRAVSEIAGVMAGKRTSEFIPLCHPLTLSLLTVEVVPDEGECSFTVTARVKTTGPTGVEMEALTAVSVACLTIYDMLKAVDPAMVISDIRLLAKSGGASGAYERKEAP